ncbi:putative siderochrome-iron transporter [Talaromyces proteolyticus]|uniref:Siderochrome-iron transporter n=1 Tax=Talaromyces proteolyticus TaxID=1131652 RepID=A0AAD4Q4C4_9EURO|nr:putative siderochrome-iron transporter [Talaromyces proteolyticus]KAH8703086.1 putative siderochrome-iron transporter [Talaromyces proteolyticus]
MGVVLDNVHNRDTSQVGATVLPTDGIPDEKAPPSAEDAAANDSDNLSLEARNEKEVLQNPDKVTSYAEAGVQKAEASALVWGKKAVYATYAWIWVCFFMLAFQSAVGNQLLFTAYSDFQNAPAIATANILATIVGGVLKLPIAKVLNLWGRSEGLVIALIVYIIGIILLASCTGPDSYAAGYVLYWIGYDALYVILDVFIADTSGMRNRAFAFGFVNTPFICTAFTGPLAAASFVKTSGWRWGYGVFSIIMPFVFLPLAVVFKFYQRKAKRLGVYNKEPSGRTVKQSLVYYLHEFDVVGAFLLMSAFILFLLPFSLQSSRRITYDSAAFICMIIIGFLLFFVFAAWERFGARVQFVRWELLKKRTVLGACLCAAALNLSFSCWDLNYYYFVMVAYNLNLADTGYMTQIYNVGSCFWGPVFGLSVRFTKQFKYTCLAFGVPLLLLGAGLQIHFRGQEGSIGYLIMCQIFIAFSGGTLVIGNDMAVMAAADRMGVPMMLSLIFMFSSLGSSIGSAVSTSIYSSTFPDALASALPDALKSNATEIYNSGYLVQYTYPVGTPTRDAINYAWGYTQKYESVAAVCFSILTIPAVAIWKNYKVDKQQNKGTML